MVRTLFITLSIFFISTFLPAQALDHRHMALENLRMVVESASQSGQNVFVEDFTGLNWPYCPSASFAIDTLLKEFPGTLHSIEWHSPNYTPDTSDFCLQTEYYMRAGLYNVSGIPHTEWNGVHSQVGGASGGNWESHYPDYVNLYQAQYDLETPFRLGISGE